MYNQKPFLVRKISPEAYSDEVVPHDDYMGSQMAAKKIEKLRAFFDDEVTISWRMYIRDKYTVEYYYYVPKIESV